MVTAREHHVSDCEAPVALIRSPQALRAWRYQEFAWISKCYNEVRQLLLRFLCIITGSRSGKSHLTNWGRLTPLNQCRNIDNANIRNTFQWDHYQNSYIFIQEIAFENVVYKMVLISSRPHFVNLIWMRKPRWPGGRNVSCQRGCHDSDDYADVLSVNQDTATHFKTGPP